MRIFFSHLISLLALCMPFRLSAEEELTLRDGRVIIGTYHEDREVLELSGNVKASISIKRADIVSRTMASPPDAVLPPTSSIKQIDVIDPVTKRLLSLLDKEMADLKKNGAQIPQTAISAIGKNSVSIDPVFYNPRSGPITTRTRIFPQKIGVGDDWKNFRSYCINIDKAHLANPAKFSIDLNRMKGEVEAINLKMIRLEKKLAEMGSERNDGIGLPDNESESIESRRAKKEREDYEKLKISLLNLRVDIAIWEMAGERNDEVREILKDILAEEQKQRDGDILAERRETLKNAIAAQPGLLKPTPLEDIHQATNKFPVKADMETSDEYSARYVSFIHTLPGTPIGNMRVFCVVDDRIEYNVDEGELQLPAIGFLTVSETSRDVVFKNVFGATFEGVSYREKIFRLNNTVGSAIDGIKMGRDEYLSGKPFMAAEFFIYEERLPDSKYLVNDATIMRPSEHHTEYRNIYVQSIGKILMNKNGELVHQCQYLSH